MLQRCENPDNIAYYKYGERGITVCKRWHDFWKFAEDMGERPSPSHSIERRDNSLGYAPDNCCWATHKEQAFNRRSTVLITWNDETKSVKQWADFLGTSPGYIYQRLKKGWNPQDALAVPPITNGTKFRKMTPRKYEPIKRNSHLLTYQGKTQTIAEWAKEYNLKYNTLKERLNAKWPLRDALKQPLQEPKGRKQPALQ